MHCQRRFANDFPCTLLCMRLSKWKFWPLNVALNKFKSTVCTYQHVILCAYLPSSLKCAWMWINEYEQDCLVCDKVSVSCSLVWQSSPGLWVLLSASISLPDTAPSPQSEHSLTFETSTVGRLIPHDMPCSLPYSISIAAQTPCVFLACTDR